MGDLETAVSGYRDLPLARRDVSGCGSCGECERACPNGIRIVERLRAAGQLFAELA
jgi:predicted aldo/keto reductase-like oxidoreductase